MDKVNSLALKVNRGLDGIRRRLDIGTGKALGYVWLKPLKVYEARKENGFDVFMYEV